MSSTHSALQASFASTAVSGSGTLEAGPQQLSLSETAALLATAQQVELARLRQCFHGAVRAQLKPLAAAIGISERTVRNHRNVMVINGHEIRPAVVCGRVTYSLEAVAHALAHSAIELPPPARVAPKRTRLAPPETTRRPGRRKKASLAEQLLAEEVVSSARAA